MSLGHESEQHRGWTQGRPHPTIPEATFIAGAAVHQAHIASGVAAQAASQAEFYQAQAYEARGAAHALHETMIRREHEYVAAANALRHEAEQQVLGAQTQVEDILRDIESRMPAVTQNIRAEVQGQAEAWASQRMQEHAVNVETQASAALERQRLTILDQARAEVNARDQRIANLEEQNARLLEALSSQPLQARTATMSRLAQETPVDDISGLTTPKSVIQKANQPGGAHNGPPEVPYSWVEPPPGLSGISTAGIPTSPQQGELTALIEQVRCLRDHLATQVVAQAAVPIPAPPMIPPGVQLRGAAGGAPPNPSQGGGSPSRRNSDRKAPPPLWPLRMANPDGDDDDPDSSEDGDDSSSDDEESPNSKGQPSAPPECRICGGYHDEVNCPYLSGSAAEVATSSSRSPVEEEESLVRVKDLKDLSLPGPPTDSGQARGYVNQVLMAIGRLQKTSGNDLYRWAQECLTDDEEGLQACARFPRTDREIAAKLLKTCKKGRWGLLFQQMVEQQRIVDGGMPCGRVMLRKIFHHFKLERDRLGMLGERNLLSLRLNGTSLPELEAFRDKYQYIMTTIPVGDLPKEQTLYNHLIDELDRCTALATKITKSREARADSKKRTCEWLWRQVELALDLEQQKKNRTDFDKLLRSKPGGWGDANVAGAPLVPGAEDKKVDKPKREKKTKKEKKDKGPNGPRGSDNAPQVPGVPAPPKGKPKGKPPPKKATPPATPRTAEATRVAKMTAAEKAKVPCMFFAYGSCRAKQCMFLHDANNKYKGPPPKALSKPPPKKASAAAAIVVPAMPSFAEPSPKISWLWDTAAGRHLVGRQLLTPDMKSCVNQSNSPVAFSTGGGAQAGQESLSFDGSKLMQGDEVYVLNNCPPAQSIGKTVMDKGFLFVWDPREDVPYLVAPEDRKRCNIRVPRKARICASRVVEYVPQYDEEVKPRAFEPPERLQPVSAHALPAGGAAEGAPEEIPEEHPEAGGDLLRSLPDYRVELAPHDPGEAAGILEEFEEELAKARAELPPHAIEISDEVEGYEPDLPEALPEEPAADPPPKVDPPPEPAEQEGNGPPKAPDPDDAILLKDLAGLEPHERKKYLILRDEALSPEHLRTHFPKNPWCRTCQVAKSTAMRVSHKPDGKGDDFIDPPTEPFTQLATDDVILAKGGEHAGTGIGGVKTHHVIRDSYSGVRLAYPLAKRDAESHAKNFRHFVGLKAAELATKAIVKCDEAGELEQGAAQAGFIPETSLPNRWPHNALLERDVREEKECCRTIHLQSGLPYEFHTHSYPFACLSMSFDRKAICDESKTQWEAATKAPFEGLRLCFGQLMYYRRKAIGKKTLEPNMAPGLFLGWRIDSGLRYRNVVKVLDYTEFRTRGNHVAIDVPETETYVEPGAPIFPIAHARDKALKEGSRDEGELPTYDLKEIPFPIDGGIASPSTPAGPKSRSVYITVDRIIKWKETPGCKGCVGTSTKHTKECRERFTRLVETEKKEAEDAAIVRASSLEPAPLPAPARPPEKEEGAAPGAPSAIAGAAVLQVKQKSMIQLCGDVPACFGLPATTSQVESKPKKRKTDLKVQNKRARKKDKQDQDRKNVFVEFACAPDSTLCQLCEDYEIPSIRLSKDNTDLLDPNVIDQLIGQIEGCEGRPNLWSSIPCTSGSPWQYVNRSQYGATFRAKLLKQEWESKKMFKHFVRVAEAVLQKGGEVSFEWPKGCSSWKRPDVRQFFERHPFAERFKETTFDGCMFGVKAKDGQPIKKPWRVMTTNQALAHIFNDEHQDMRRFA